MAHNAAHSRHTIYTETPDLHERASFTAVDLQAYIDSCGITARLIDDVGHTPTVPAAAAVMA